MHVELSKLSPPCRAELQKPLLIGSSFLTCNQPASWYQWCLNHHHEDDKHCASFMKGCFSDQELSAVVKSHLQAYLLVTTVFKATNLYNCARFEPSQKALNASSQQTQTLNKGAS